MGDSTLLENPLAPLSMVPTALAPTLCLTLSYSAEHVLITLQQPTNPAMPSGHCHPMVVSKHQLTILTTFVMPRARSQLVSYGLKCSVLCRQMRQYSVLAMYSVKDAKRWTMPIRNSKRMF